MIGARTKPMRRQRRAKGRPVVDKAALAIAARPPLRDEAYIVALRGMRCIFTGRLGTDSDSVVPMHIGTGGKGVKIDDNCAVPALWSLHSLGHNGGEISMIREHLPDDVLRDALRAYAREMYEKWRNG